MLYKLSAVEKEIGGSSSAPERTPQQGVSNASVNMGGPRPPSAETHILTLHGEPYPMHDQVNKYVAWGEDVCVCVCVCVCMCWRGGGEGGGGGERARR